MPDENEPLDAKNAEQAEQPASEKAPEPEEQPAEPAAPSAVVNAPAPVDHAKNAAIDGLKPTLPTGQ